MNKRNGNLTFISEAIVQAIDLVKKYDQFFDTNALYVFTDGKSEPYSPKWSKGKIRDRKRRNVENFKKIFLVGKEHGLNIWLGVLKWDAFDDAKSFVKKMGKGGHLVDLTDFNRLSLEKALTNFAETVRTTVRLAEVGDIDLGNIPYNTNLAYEKNVSLSIQTDRANGHPSIMGRINLDPENLFEVAHEYPLAIRTTEDKMVLNVRIDQADELKPGTYRGKLNLYPSHLHFGALAIEPSQLNVVFKKSGFLSFYFWRVLVIAVIGSLSIFYLTNKIKRKMPVKL
jgi:hypothetical protein